MLIHRRQSGFAIVGLLLIVVVVVIIGFGGWWVYQKHNTATITDNTPSSNAQSPVANNVSSAPPITSTDDLDAALNTLNQNDPSAANSDDSSQLSSQADGF